jgi:hypothetical protein
LLGIRVDDGDAIVQVLAKGLEVFVGLAAFVDSFYNGLLALTTACIERPGGRVDGILASIAAGTITQSSAACAVNLYGAGSNLELVGTEGMMWVVLRGEVVGESACGEMGGGSKRLGEVAAVAGEAGGRGAVGAFAAVEDLGEEAVSQSVIGRQSPAISCDMFRMGKRTVGRAAGSGAGGGPGRTRAGDGRRARLQCGRGTASCHAAVEARGAGGASIVVYGEGGGRQEGQQVEDSELPSAC